MRIGVNVRLGLFDRAVSRKLLHIAQTAARSKHQARRIGDKGPTAGVGAAAFEPEFLIEPRKPIDHATRP
jgi:hypothetical protein